MKIKLLPTFLLMLTQTFVFSQTTVDYGFTKSGLPADESGCKFLINFNTSDIMVDSLPKKPLIGNIKPIDCGSTGSVVLSGLPSGNWVINPGSITGSGTNATIIGLAVGSYSFTVTNEFGIATEIERIIITDKSSSTWTNSWSNGIPTISTNVILEGNYDTAINPSITACSLTISAGVSLTITDGKFVAIQNNLTVNKRATLNIINEGSLLMLNDLGMIANDGIIKVNKTATLCGNSNYTH